MQIEAHGYETMPAFQQFEHALRTSHKPEATSAFAEVFGCEMWEYFKKHPEKERRFSRGMKSCDALGNIPLLPDALQYILRHPLGRKRRT